MEHDFEIAFDWDDVGALYVTNEMSCTYGKRFAMSRCVRILFALFLKALGRQIEKEQS